MRAPMNSQTRCVYCGYPGAKMRGGAWTCYSCRDLPVFERAADAEIEAMITAWYEGTWSKSAEGSIVPKDELDPRGATPAGDHANAVRRPTIGSGVT